MLRFITCGSVDDGKSTLIGRLLYEANVLFDDHLAALKSDSKRFGTQGDNLDFALLLDGLTAEREQGITIDVAYRFFSTGRRRFIVADTPGHEQYTRNMVTGASTADAAVLLVDARKGVLIQTRRHSYVASLLGIRHVLLAVNKMDLVDYSREAFSAIEQEFLEFATQIGLPDVACVPVSALHGDNILTSSERTRWYRGPTVMEYLEAVEIDDTRLEGSAFRLPVQWVNRPHADFRGFAGTIVSGTVRRGDRVCVEPSARKTRVARIVTYEGELESAGPGQAITLTLADELDISRGDIICNAADPAEVADQFEATIVWMSDDAMLPGRPYSIKIGTKIATVMMGRPKFRVNINTLEHVAATTLRLNEIGVCTMALDRPIAFDPYSVNRDTGGFIVIDKMSNNTVGAGLLHFALRRAHNIRWQALDVDKGARAAQNGQKPCVLWFTGLSGAGKSTIANLVEKHLHGRGLHTYLLDGDNIRHHLNRDLGFTEVDRVENIRRVAEVARLMVDAGLIVLVAFISPFRAERRLARSLVEEGEFVEIFIDTPLSVAEARDPKGLYKKARQGALKNFTGVDSPYERPEAAELTIDTTTTSPDTAVGVIVALLEQRGVIDVS